MTNRLPRRPRPCCGCWVPDLSVTQILLLVALPFALGMLAQLIWFRRRFRRRLHERVAEHVGAEIRQEIEKEFLRQLAGGQTGQPGQSRELPRH